MNQQFYRYFEVLAEERNYTRAAGILGIAQSSLSHGIQCLENELSVPLCEKRGRGVVLTPQGALFLPYVSRSLRILEEGKAQLLQVCDGIISIGVVSSFRSHLMERIRSFRENIKTSWQKKYSARIWFSLRPSVICRKTRTT